MSDRTEGKRRLLGSSDVEVAATLENPPGNVTVDADGRMFVSFLPDTNFGPVKVGLVSDGRKVEPFPSAAFQDELHTVLGIRMDRHGRLWILDHGKFGLHRPKLYAFDVKTRRKVHEITFGILDAPPGSMLNDLRALSRAPPRQGVQRVRALFGKRVRLVALFGSRARSEAHEESDIDVCVVVDDLSWRERREVNFIAGELLDGRDVLVSPFALSTEHMDLLRSRAPTMHFARRRRWSLRVFSRGVEAKSHAGTQKMFHRELTAKGALPSFKAERFSTAVRELLKREGWLAA